MAYFCAAVSRICLVVGRSAIAAIPALLLLSLSITACAQDPPLGILPFSTQATGQYDSIDMATGVITFQIPVRSKIGGIPFSIKLVGNQGVGKDGELRTVTVAGLWPQAFAGDLGARETNSEPFQYTTCNGENDEEVWVESVVDSTGTSHPLPAQVPVDNLGCFRPIVTTTDGSGYTVAFQNMASWTIYDSSGNKGTNNGDDSPVNLVTNPDGVTVSGIFGIAPNSYTDSLGTTILSESGGVVPGSTPTLFQYTDAAGTIQSFQVNYSQYTQATNFGCTGVTDIAPRSVYLESSITIPGGGTFNISYEPTPGYGGDVTGRISKIAFPAGGYVAYTYTGGNNGLDCNSEVVPTLTRTLSDNNGNVNTWTYINSNTTSTSEINPNFTVTATDPAGNQTVYLFSGEIQTQAAYYQGSASGTPLKLVTTCYNANFSSCSTWRPSNYAPFLITQTDVYTSFNGGTNNLVETKFDSYGNTTAVAAYDFGVNTGAAPTVSPLTTTLSYYGQSWNGSSCTAYASGTYIYNTPCYSYTTNSAGTTVATTQITYSNTGHPTSMAKWVSGSSSLTSTATYNPNGTIATATDVNGAVTTYAYNGTGGCNDLLLTSTAFPTDNLATSQTWNCNGGVLVSSTDPNGQVTQYGYANESGIADPLWRRLSVTDPLLNVTWTDYSAGGVLPETVETYMNFPASNPTSTIDIFNTLDGLGRVIQSKRRTAAGGSIFDSTVGYTYPWNSTGAYTTQTVPGGTAVTTTQLDAVGRTLSVTDGGGGATSFSYTNNDVLATLGPAPSGENAKRRQLQYDGLGRLTSTCEITTGTTTWPGGNCAQSTPQTGYRSTYTYDALSDLVSVTQNAQSSTSQGRSYSYDGLKRMTSETNPENGTVSYTYDSNNNNGCASSSAGDLVQVVKASGVENCYYYDQLHRLITVGNNDEGAANGESPCKRFRYDSASNGVQTAPSGYPSQPYVAGRLMEAETDNCSGTVITDEWFSYNADGQMTGIWELTPHSGQYYYSSASPAANGAVTSVQLASPSLYTMTWTLDGEGRTKTLTDTTTGTSIVTSATYWPSTYSPTVTLTGTDNDSYTMDANTGRMKQYVFTVGSSSMTGVVNWNANWTPNQVEITDEFNSGGTQTCNYNPTTESGTGYDDLGRLIGGDCGSGQWGQTFSYDPFGNITQAQISGRQGTTWNPGYNESNNHCTGCTYDGDGNVTGDGNYVYGFDAYGKLLWTADSGTPTCGTSGRCLVYDAFGRIVEQSSGSTWYERWLAQAGMIEMSGTTPSFAQWSAPGGGTETIGGNGGYFDYLHVDWLGSSRVISNSVSHAITTDQAYSPYGDIYDRFGASGSQYNIFAGTTEDFFGGVMWDTPNRELSQFSGRWLSPDPAGIQAVDPTNPQSWNRYAYVLNNPLSNIDPLGLDCVRDNGDGTTTTYTDDEDDCQGDNGFYFDGTVTQAAIDANGNALASVNGQFQCAGDSGCSIYNNLTSITVNGTQGQVGTLTSNLTGYIPFSTYPPSMFTPGGTPPMAQIGKPHLSRSRAKARCSLSAQLDNNGFDSEGFHAPNPGSALFPELGPDVWANTTQVLPSSSQPSVSVNPNGAESGEGAESVALFGYFAALGESYTRCMEFYDSLVASGSIGQ